MRVCPFDMKISFGQSQIELDVGLILTSRVTVTVRTVNFSLDAFNVNSLKILIKTKCTIILREGDTCS